MKFNDYLEDLFYDYAGEDMPVFDDMEPAHKRKLMSLYIAENEDLVHDLDAEMHESSKAYVYSELALAEYPATMTDIDAWGYLQDCQRVIQNSITLRDLIDAEICRLYPRWLQDYEADASDFYAARMQ